MGKQKITYHLKQTHETKGGVVDLQAEFPAVHGRSIAFGPYSPLGIVHPGLRNG